MRRILVGLVGAALLAGCTPEAPATSSPAPTPSVESSAPAPSVEAPSPSPSASPSESPSPSQSPSPTAVESFPPAPAIETPEQAEIRAAWMKYWEVYDKFAADPTLSDLTETQHVTSGEESVVIIQSIQELRDAGLIAKGGWAFREVVVGEAATNAAGTHTAEIQYCADRSSLRIIEEATLQPPAGEPLQNLLETATLERGADSVWRVSMRRNQSAEC